jgi:hypothetical protein
MEQAYISTISALAGTVVGGVTSFATSWVMQTAQARAARLATERTKREELYGRFMDDLALLYSHALSNDSSDSLDYGKLVSVFALKGRITLLSSQPVVASADRTVKFLVDIYMGPKRTAQDVRTMLEDHSGDAIDEFARVCRGELENLRVA